MVLTWSQHGKKMVLTLMLNTIKGLKVIKIFTHLAKMGSNSQRANDN